MEYMFFTQFCPDDKNSHCPAVQIWKWLWIAADDDNACQRKPTYEVLQDEIPADEERHKFSHRDVRVHVRAAARPWHAHGEFSVAHACISGSE